MQSWTTTHTNRQNKEQAITDQICSCLRLPMVKTTLKQEKNNSLLHRLLLDWLLNQLLNQWATLSTTNHLHLLLHSNITYTLLRDRLIIETISPLSYQGLRDTPHTIVDRILDATYSTRLYKAFKYLCRYFTQPLWLAVSTVGFEALLPPYWRYFTWGWCPPSAVLALFHLALMPSSAVLALFHSALMPSFRRIGVISLRVYVLYQTHWLGVDALCKTLSAALAGP